MRQFPNRTDLEQLEKWECRVNAERKCEASQPRPEGAPFRLLELERDRLY